jgi:hypothetical protein
LAAVATTRATALTTGVDVFGARLPVTDTVAHGTSTLESFDWNVDHLSNAICAEKTAFFTGTAVVRRTWKMDDVVGICNFCGECSVLV